jgi:hypothetical protein
MAKKAMIETWEQSMPVESALFVAFVVLLFMAFAVALAWAQWHAGAAEQDSATLHSAE